MKFRIFILAVFLCTILTESRLAAQPHWTLVFNAPACGSSAYFINPNEGCIGIGNYPGGFPAQIYYTRNGGATWTRSVMPNMTMLGQVTDIFFRDRLNGWACVREAIEHGWSGLYRTFDGGETWQQWYQSIFPVSVRETSRGVYLSDRTASAGGVEFSNDGGNTFKYIVISSGALGLDFLDDNIGIFSTEGNTTEPYLVTSDGGTTWTPFPLRLESWSTFADPATKKLFFCSERDVPYPGTQSTIGMTKDLGITYNQNLALDTTDVFSGGINGNKGCRSAIYVQQEVKGRNFSGGLIRSTDGGTTWVNVGGPYNYNDKRFAVTGRGAVVYAFDRTGGVWKTSDGGDGKLSSSVLGSVAFSTLPSSNSISSKLCDSASEVIHLAYSDCDSVSLEKINFINDGLGELSTSHQTVFFGHSGSSSDSAIITFKPMQIASKTERIRLTIRQGDGYLQDTIITLDLQGLAANDVPSIAEVRGDSLGFGTRSVCGDDSVRVITITNAGCAPMNVISLSVSGSAFSLLSSFSPIALGPGISRQYLIRFNPNLIGTQFGALILQTGNARDSVVLSGIGRPGSRGYKLSQPNITSTMCDSAEGTLVLRNISCTQVTISSIGIAPPFRFDPVATPVTMATDSAIVLKYHFVPNTPGMYNAAVTINSLNVNDVFDTSLTLVGVATEGTANISYSPPALNFDSVSVCSLREFDISIASTGCDTLAIPLDTLTTDTTEFHIVSDVSSRAVLRGDTVHIKVRFHPPGVGSFSSVLHIQTNTGPINIPMQGIGSSDPGVLSLSGVTLGNILTCKDTTFSFTIENTTCDSLVLDSIRVTGIGRSDYVTTYTAPTPLGLGAKNTFTTHFIPQAGGNRNAILHCYLHKTDGTLVEKNTPLNGVGVAPVPIRLSLPSITYSTLAGAPIQIPVTVLDTSYIDVGTTTFSLSLNTDLLTPTNFDLTGSIFGGASVIGFNVVKTGVTISLSVPPGERFHSGLLGTLDCIPFVSDTITTDIIESTFTAFDKDTSANCLPTALITPPQTITSFTLAPACGISTLTKYLRYGPSGIFIQSISPNPAHSEIIFSALLDPIPDGDLAIDILDDAGALVQSEHIPHSELRSPFVHTMNILGASGTRTLRLQSGASETLGRFVLVK